MRNVRAAYLFDPEAIANGWAIMRITAGYEGDLLIMSREHPWPARGSGPTGPARYRVDRWRCGQIASIILAASSNRLLHAQMLPTDRWLVVASRTKSEQDTNARVYDSEGALIYSFHAGDGIEDVQTTSDGQIWISYFDEGVYGDVPLGGSGLVCLGQGGRVQFRYPTVTRPAALPPIDDCYALNVATNEDTWIYYYGAFPLVHLRRQELAGHWSDIAVRGSHAFAVDGGRALFQGGYKQNDRFFLLSLDPAAVDEVQIVDERGDAPLPNPAYHPHSCFGRGARLYIVTGRGLFVVDMSELSDS